MDLVNVGFDKPEVRLLPHAWPLSTLARGVVSGAAAPPSTQPAVAGDATGTCRSQKLQCPRVVQRPAHAQASMPCLSHHIHPSARPLARTRVCTLLPAQMFYGRVITSSQELATASNAFVRSYLAAHRLEAAERGEEGGGGGGGGDSGPGGIEDQQPRAPPRPQLHAQPLSGRAGPHASAAPVAPAMPAPPGALAADKAAAIHALLDEKAAVLQRHQDAAAAVTPAAGVHVGAPGAAASTAQRNTAAAAGAQGDGSSGNGGPAGLVGSDLRALPGTRQVGSGGRGNHQHGGAGWWRQFRCAAWAGRHHSALAASLAAARCMPACMHPAPCPARRTTHECSPRRHRRPDLPGCAVCCCGASCWQ